MSPWQLSPHRATPRPRSLRILLGLGAFLFVLATLSGARVYLGYRTLGHQVELSDALGTAAMECGLWVLLTPALVGLARWAFRARHSIVQLALCVATGALLSLVHVLLFAGLSAWVRQARFGEGSLAAELRSSFLFKLHSGALIAASIVLLVLLFDAFERSAEESLRRAELDRELSTARLHRLRAQLRPHFLFNTLHTIAASIARDPHDAEAMIVDLSDLLRATLSQEAAEEHSLREELRLVELYLGIQTRRFGDRLSIEQEIDPDTLGASVPCFVLQPLVENAIQHGIAPRPGPGRLRIAASRAQGSLELCVADDGVGWKERGRDADHGAGRGIGLEITRSRLDLIYGGAGSVELDNAADGGACVRVRVPVN